MWMALGVAVVAPRFQHPREMLGEGSIYRLLADEGDGLFPEEYFVRSFPPGRCGAVRPSRRG